MTKIGLVGCGNWSRHILRDLKTLGCHVSVVARSEESRSRAERGEADLGAALDHGEIVEESNIGQSITVRGAATFTRFGGGQLW